MTLSNASCWQIFGPNEDEPLDVEGAWAAMEEMTKHVNDYGANHGQAKKSIEEVAMGFVRVANEAMSRPIRSLTQMKVGCGGLKIEYAKTSQGGNCMFCSLVDLLVTLVGMKAVLSP